MQGDLDEPRCLEVVLAEGRLRGGSFFQKPCQKKRNNMKIEDEQNESWEKFALDRCIRRGLAGSI